MMDDIVFRTIIGSFFHLLTGHIYQVRADLLRDLEMKVLCQLLVDTAVG